MGVGRSKLDDRQEAAIAALLAERTHALAAEKAGIGPATLSRWLREPAFKAAYRAARRALVDSAIGRLQQGATRAVDALERNLTCGVPAVEVSASRAMLEQAMKAIEHIDLVERVDELEGLLKGTHDGDERDESTENPP